MTTPDFKLRQVYNFDVYPTGIIGNNFQNATILSTMDAESANKEIDIVAKHIQVYPSLPTDTPNDAFAYDYVKIRTSSGQTTVLGLPWIKNDTVVLVDARTITATIGNVTASDLSRIKAILNQNNYNNVALSIT